MRPSIAKRTESAVPSLRPKPHWLDLEDAINESIALSTLVCDRITLLTEIGTEANMDGAAGAGLISLTHRVNENLCTQFNSVHAQWATNEGTIQP